MAAICPDGHPTEDTEYCEECGLRVPTPSGARPPGGPGDGRVRGSTTGSAGGERSAGGSVGPGPRLGPTPAAPGPGHGPGGGTAGGPVRAAEVAALIGDAPTSAHVAAPRAGAGHAGAAPAPAGSRADRSGAEHVPPPGGAPAANAVPPDDDPADLLEPPAPTLLLTPGRRPRLRGPSTVGRLRLLAAVTVAALVLAFGALAVGTRAAQTAIDDTGQDIGPRIIATADLPRALAETDAHLAALVLLGDDPDHADERAAELEAYQDSGGAAADLVLGAHDLAVDVEGRPEPTAAATDPAAAAIEGEAAAQDPADAPTPTATPEDAHGATAQAIDLAQAYARYRELAGRALALSESATYPAGEVPSDVAAARAEAARHLREEVLPLAEAVSLDATRTAFHRTKDAHDTVATARVAVAFGSAAALAALIALQVFLARRFHRTFSPALLVATAVTAIYTYTGVTVMATQTDVLTRMTADGLVPVATQAALRTEDTVEAADSTDARTGASVGAGSLDPYQDDPAEAEEAAAVFTASVAAGDAAIGGLGFLIPVSMLSIAVVVVVGTAPRLAEYR
ncbi:hypothetical protein [Nocardiopsis sp. NRRL B-16309]|uniref:hypothetical protein n=1 Tax=Nocardiopsis sp. NRRL B-16309 TaxID=1519494 RepID=UPI0006AE0734|nr:hypothetical protein [Nocardiopsis sp. NRRL B-16309]KOX19627.1 hypothetical protein ADL05_05610 [Nocardiopsis sp. NRRL B-16309]